jgi:hypothetical protein
MPSPCPKSTVLTKRAQSFPRAQIDNFYAALLFDERRYRHCYYIHRGTVRID